MAKIIKVGSTTSTPQVANPFRTSRSSTTNPFKYSNFEGNTLQFADVFDGFEPSFKGTQTKGIGKLKMIASSVTGSMTKMKTGITESITNFINRIGGGLSSAWTYAKNTNVSDIPAIKAFNNFMNTPVCLPEIKGLSIPMDAIKDRLSASMKLLNTDITTVGKNISDKLTTMISKVHTQKISAQTPVTELEQLWKNEIALAEAL